MIPRNANDGNQILLFGNTLNRSGGMGSRSLPSVAFPVLITREVETLELHHLVCARRPGAACVHSHGRSRQHGSAGSCLTQHLSPEMWHSFSSSECNLNSQITVVLDIAGPGGLFWYLPSLSPLSCSSWSNRVPYYPHGSYPVGVQKYVMVAVLGQKGRSGGWSCSGTWGWDSSRESKDV